MNYISKKWRCNVCGYIHQGDAPPDFCPICGASKDEFSLVDEKVEKVKFVATQWQCLNCNYIAQGSKPPAQCPICGVTQERFLHLPAEERKVLAPKDDPRIVIIGAGIAGVSAAESIRKITATAPITIVSKEVDLPYYRLNLTRLLSGDVAEEDLDIYSNKWFLENNINLIRGVEANRIQVDEKNVTLSSGDTLPFDKLIIATGAHPFIPSFPGVSKEGVMVLRTKQDAHVILEGCNNKSSYVCIGGGVLGIEAAGALAKRGLQVSLLESHEWLMPRQLNRRAGEILANHLKKLGINLLIKAKTKEILGDEGVAGVLLQDGRVVHSDKAIIATGVRPNSYLARLANLEVNNGIVVDSFLKTSHNDIFAAGDLTEHNGTLYGNWSAAQYQGSIAGLNVIGIPTEFGGIPRSNTLKILDINLVSVGQFTPEDGSYLVIEEEEGEDYKRLLFRDNILVGYVLIGDIVCSQYLKNAVETKQPFQIYIDETTTIASVLSSLT
jgi:nitrite reductase (NADH) large subunit